MKKLLPYLTLILLSMPAYAKTYNYFCKGTDPKRIAEQLYVWVNTDQIKMIVEAGSPVCFGKFDRLIENNSKAKYNLTQCTRTGYVTVTPDMIKGASTGFLHQEFQDNKDPSGYFPNDYACTLVE